MSLYKSEEFAEAWHKCQTKKPDTLRVYMMNEIMINEIGKLSGKIVLDAGCGDGFFLPHLLKLNPKRVYAFDVSPYLVNICKRKVKSEKIKYDVMDLTNPLAYRSNFFDVVISYNVLMDLPKIETAVKELSRVTTPGGLVLVCLVHPFYNLFVNDKEARKQPVMERLRRYTKSEHLFVKTITGYDNFKVYRRPISEYVNCFVKNGFRIEKLREVPISKEVAKKEKKFKKRIGVPVFLFFKLKKE